MRLRNQVTETSRVVRERIFVNPPMKDIKINQNQVWKRKDNGMLVRVTGLIFSEPRRVSWQALPDQDIPAAYGTVTESEFKRQYEYAPR